MAGASGPRPGGGPPFSAAVAAATRATARPRRRPKSEAEAIAAARSSRAAAPTSVDGDATKATAATGASTTTKSERVAARLGVALLAVIARRHVRPPGVTVLRVMRQLRLLRAGQLHC